MTPRERTLRTLQFQAVDRIPFDPGSPRESTQARWRREGMAEGVDWRDAVAGELGIDWDRGQAPDVNLDVLMIPQFEEKVLEHRDDHLIVQDWKGNICEISDEFDVSYLRSAKDFVTRRWIRCPVATRDDWEQMKTRYDADDPARLPADINALCVGADQRTGLLQVGTPGVFWQLREWCGFEGLCLLMVEQSEWVDEMAEFWCGFVDRSLRRLCRHVRPDILHISEDMAYKHKAMISPAMTRRYCMPAWARWTQTARTAGIEMVAVDSDGFIGELIPLWVESGISVCDPIEVAAGNDLNEFRQQFDRDMAYRGGVDKRAIAAGGAAIRRELTRLDPVLREGGYIPGCDHGVPSDVSWSHYLDYARLLAERTGWR